ncbi:MAG: SLC13 family permease [Methanocorpusculum sp.]|nr:SLC13 family permease [Methanocorpusculum sp.]
MIPIAVFIVALVFLLIIVRHIGKRKLPIWVIMTAGAVAAIIFQCISVQDAVFAINYEVIVFLFLMFIFGAALDKSGILHSVSVSAFAKAKTKKRVLLIFIAVTALASAFLMNDTIAIIGTPIALFCAKKYNLPAKTMLLALCFSVTFGSSVTPIGNPQNLLIAMSEGVPYAFPTFALYLLVPALISLAVVYFILSISVKDDVAAAEIETDVTDYKLAGLCKISFVIVIAMIIARIVLSVFSIELPFVLIAAAAAAPLLIFSRKRVELLKNVDYTTLLFFASMFILMAAVWNSGFIQTLLPDSISTSVPVLLFTGVIVSQFVSNVPFVLMILPVLETAGAALPMYMAAVAGTTCAGTLTILGAASTIIVIQHAEKSGESLSFIQYFKTGAIVTVIASAVYCGWIMMIGMIF